MPTRARRRGKKSNLAKDTGVSSLEMRFENGETDFLPRRRAWAWHPALSGSAARPSPNPLPEHWAKGLEEYSARGAEERGAKGEDSWRGQGATSAALSDAGSPKIVHKRTS